MRNKNEKKAAAKKRELNVIKARNTTANMSRQIQTKRYYTQLNRWASTQVQQQ